MEFAYILCCDRTNWSLDGWKNLTQSKKIYSVHFIIFMIFVVFMLFWMQISCEFYPSRIIHVIWSVHQIQYLLFAAWIMNSLYSFFWVWSATKITIVKVLLEWKLIVRSIVCVTQTSKSNCVQQRTQNHHIQILHMQNIKINIERN